MLDPEMLDMQELKQRLLVTQALEAARTVEEGVITDPREADVGSILGFGFAPYTGGALSYIDFMGPKAFVDLCKSVAGEARRAVRAAQDPVLDMAASGETFYGQAASQEKGGVTDAAQWSASPQPAQEIDPMKSHLLRMAEYNAWCNQRVYDAVLPLSDAEYREDRGAFFKSIHGTLNHLLATDRIWMKRFTGEGEAPTRLDAVLYEIPPGPASRKAGRGCTDHRLRERLDRRDNGTTLSIHHDLGSNGGGGASVAGFAPRLQPSDPPSRAGSLPSDAARIRGALAGSHPVRAAAGSADITLGSVCPRLR